MLLEPSGVLFADRDAGRGFCMPDAVECPEGLRRLVVRATGRRRHDHCDSAAQAELQADVIRPEPRDFPVDERDLPADVEAVELPPAASPDDDELRGDAASRVSGTPPNDAHSKRTPSSSSTYASSSRHASTGTGSSTTSTRPASRISAAMNAGRLAFLRRAGDAEAEWMRSERLEPLDDMTEVLGGDAAHWIPSSTPSSVSATRSPSVLRS